MTSRTGTGARCQNASVQGPCVSDQQLARRLLGVPEDRFCPVLITLGTPADRPLTPIQRPARRPFNEVVHHGHW